MTTRDLIEQPTTDAVFKPGATTGELPPCSDCGARPAPDQRYCLECGNAVAEPRVPVPEVTAEQPNAGIQAADSVAPDAPAAPLKPDADRNKHLLYGACGAAAFIAVAIGAGAIGAGLGSEETPTATPIIQAAAPAATAATGATAAAFTSDWTATETTWTIVLEQLPKQSTQPDQVAQAKAAATGKGLEAGALDTDENSGDGLDSGQYAIYSGSFASKKAAGKQLKVVKSKGYPSATVVEIGGSGGEEVTSAKAKADSDKLKEIESLPAEQQQKERLKLPNEVETEGKKVPKDDKEPGGGSEGTTIGSIKLPAIGGTATTDPTAATGAPGERSKSTGFRLVCDWPPHSRRWTVVAGERISSASTLVARYAAQNVKASVAGCVDIDTEQSRQLVYSGWHAGRPQAERALARLRKLGFRQPYVARVSGRRAPVVIAQSQPTTSTGATGASTEATP